MARQRVVGLDIGSSAVRAVEVERSGRDGTVTRIVEVPLPQGVVRDGEVVEKGPVSAAIKKIWSSEGVSGRKVVLGIGNQRVVVRNMAMSSMPLDQLRQAAVYQAQETLPMSVDEALVDFLPTHEFASADGDMVGGLFVAAMKETVSLNVLSAEHAGISPQLVDLNAFALVRSVAGGYRDRDVVCVDIGARVTNVVIVSKGQPQLVRVIAAGTQDATDAVARVLKITEAEAEALKRQIGMSTQVPEEYREAMEAIQNAVRTIVEPVVSTLGYYVSRLRGSHLDLMLLSGGGSNLPGLGQYLSSAARLDAGLAAPFHALKVGKSAGRERFADRESSFAVATGLALADVS